MANTIQMRKWYVQMRGYGGCDSVEVAAFAETGRTAGRNVSSLFSGKDGGIREHFETPVYKAISKNGDVCEIEANELQSNGAIGIGSLAERFYIPDLTDEELERLKAKGEAAEAERKAAKEKAKREREEARARFEKDYAYLPNKCAEGRCYMAVAKVADNVRVNLKTVFAGQKFSVRSKSFSGGEDISVEWVNGPTEKEVVKVTGKYEDSKTDFTGDYRDYAPTAFNDIFGGAKYVWETRKEQEDFEKIVRDFCGIAYNEPMQTANGFSGMSVRWVQYHDVKMAWRNTSFPCGAKITGVYALSEDEIKRVNEDGTAKPIMYGFMYDAPAPKNGNKGGGRKPREKVEGVTVTLNAEKKGVEIRFPSIPSEEVRTKLKGEGWRWSRFGGCWYNRDTEENRRFANALVA